MPTNAFFRGLLHWYRIELVHLNPKSILHIATFIHLCKVFLSIRPHFNLFRYLFALKPNQKGGKISVVWGAGLQLRQGRGDDYLGLRFKTSLKGWHQRWFYISNPSPSLCTYVGHRPVVRDSWNSLPTTEEMEQVNVLVDWLNACKKDDGVNGVDVVLNFLGRRV